MTNEELLALHMLQLEGLSNDELLGEDEMASLREEYIDDIVNDYRERLEEKDDDELFSDDYLVDLRQGEIMKRLVKLELELIGIDEEDKLKNHQEQPIAIQ